MNFQAVKLALCGIFLAVTLMIAGGPVSASAATLHPHAATEIAVTKIPTTIAHATSSDRGVLDQSRAPAQPGIFQARYQMHYMRPGLAKATIALRLPDNSVAAFESRWDGVVPRPVSFQSSFLVENTRAPRAPPRLIAA